MGKYGRRRLRIFGSAVAFGLTAVLLIATPAQADTSQVSASALQIGLVGGGVASSGTFTASNTDGGSEVTSGNNAPALTVLGSQNVITAGVLGQYGTAEYLGVSHGCAGVLGAGGTFQFGPGGDCTVTPGAEVTFTLGTSGLASINLRADAIYATCTATSTPTATGDATLTNARITSTTLGVETTLLDLSLDTSPNTGLTVPGLLSIVVNSQTSSGPGQIDVAALRIEALSGTLASLVIGNVICGPNAIAPPIPVIPVAGAPLAAGVLAAAGLGWYLVRRRRNAAAQAA
ncbi:choice-of-anchor P family protein [Solwaraspora sp. WMMD406]|uniref:choice-of-anchor P family protein n=1 Tax=Solwaraspora sp. WMMD406 TaxID=3016095 RepID=UPI0024172A05|nr:choice-of-anchor P family protein [Solwaraspora sp. WMMD406]MDG4767031.1 choice-of-anchor P family protein [Solwaraspora sp. WMMD406]